MGILDNLQVIDKEHYIDTGVCKRSYGANGVYCVKPKNSCANRNDRWRCFRAKVITAHSDGGITLHHRIPPEYQKSKAERMA